MDYENGYPLMSVVRAIVATVLATTLAIGIVLAELDEAAINVAADAGASQEALEVLAEESGPLNFDSTFLLLTTAIIILVVPDAIAYFRRRKSPEPARAEDDE